MKKYLLAVGLILLILIFSYTSSIYMSLASLSYFLIVWGFLVRKTNRIQHIRLMNTGIIIDLGLVLTLEFQRQAIDTALSFDMSWPEQAHIGFSTLATVLYIPLLITGWKMFKAPNPKLRKIHIPLGVSAFIFRSLGFIFMFTLDLN